MKTTFMILGGVVWSVFWYLVAATGYTFVGLNVLKYFEVPLP